MTTTGLEIFDTTVQKTNRWLAGIAERLDHRDRQHAYQALRGVLHALRDRLTIDEAAHLGAQLPMLVRGIFFEAWQPARPPTRNTCPTSSSAWPTRPAPSRPTSTRRRRRSSAPCSGCPARR